MPTKIYTSKDASLAPLKGKTLAVIGFGSQGHAHALNLKDSGMRVIIGLYPNSKSIPLARRKGFAVYSTAQAVQKADVALIATPDMIIPELYRKEIAPYLTNGKTLIFLHGLCVHYGLIKLPKNIDICMVAPKGPGHIVRRMYEEGKGVPALIAVHQNPSRQAKKTALAWANGIGATRAGALETTFQEEVETDLFGEQAVLCGGMSALVLAGYETLVEAGYQPEAAYLECLHELKLIVDLMNESGIAGMRFSISETAKYGDVTRGPVIINKQSRAIMKRILQDIQSGRFTREWVKEHRSGKKKYNRLLKQAAKHPIEKTGARLRGIMPWMKKRQIGATQAAYS